MCVLRILRSIDRLARLQAIIRGQRFRQYYQQHIQRVQQVAIGVLQYSVQFLQQTQVQLTQRYQQRVQAAVILQAAFHRRRSRYTLY